MIGINTITNSLGNDKDITNLLPKPKIVVSPWKKNDLFLLIFMKYNNHKNGSKMQYL